jgi:hypothetical protein
MAQTFSEADKRRFWEKVTPEPNSGCWLWAGSTQSNGYGQFQHGGRRDFAILRAHRVSYFLSLGLEPRLQSSDMKTSVVMHSCDNRSCVNPGHLSIGTASRNQLDCLSRGRRAQAKLSIGDVAEIRLRLAAGETGRALSDEYGVSGTQISNIKHRRSWSEHL